MRLLLWTTAALGVWILGGVYSSGVAVRKARWLILANLGFGFCCLLLGMHSLEQPPLGHPFWTRLLWSSLVLLMPTWVAFAHRFGRPSDARPGITQNALLSLLWVSGAALLVFGLTQPPLELVWTDAGRTVTVLQPPVGRWITIHLLVGMSLLLWNLHGTLEAARAAGRRTVSRAIYALLPLIMTGLYILAEFLLYGQKGEGSTDLLLGATFLSTTCFAAALGGRKLRDMDLPVGTQIMLSSAVLTALGVFFVALALIAEILRLLGGSPQARWYEEVGVGVLVTLFSLWILPGVREEFRRFVNRRLYVPPITERDTWTRIDLAVGTVDNVHDLTVALRVLMRDRFGPIRMHLWTYEPVAGDFVPADSGRLARLSPRHPLIRALQSRIQPLLIGGQATRIDEIPIHAAGEEMAEQHGLCVFFPMRQREQLVAVMGCGPGADRTLHPEDLELLQKIADVLAARVALISGNEAAATTFADTKARENTDVREIPIRPWLEDIARRVLAKKNDPPGVRIDVSGPERVLLDRSLVEPIIYYLFEDAIDPNGSDDGEIPVAVTIMPTGKIAFDFGRGKTTLSLRLLPGGIAGGKR